MPDWQISFFINCFFDPIEKSLHRCSDQAYHLQEWAIETALDKGSDSLRPHVGQFALHVVRVVIKFTACSLQTPLCTF